MIPAMETLNVILQGNFRQAISSIQTRKTHLNSKLSSPSPPQIDSPKWVSMRSHQPSSYSGPLITKRNLQCTVERKNECKGISDIEKVKPTSTIRRKNLAVFVSGGGSNFRSIYEATVHGSVHGDVVALVTNIHNCGGAEFASSKDIPVIIFPKRKDSQDAFSAEDLVIALRTCNEHLLNLDVRGCSYPRSRSYSVDFILLAGYLKLIPVELIKAYPKAILNIHPSLLPAFGGKGYYGMKVHKAVIASGASYEKVKPLQVTRNWRYSGPTIHYVDEEYDTGRILAQRVVSVLPNDTAEDLAARVLHEEHKVYVEVSAALCEERIVWREDGVPLIRTKENPNDYR
ncbi:Phosphoribosylglycinamide formyltransferase (GART) [Orobanche minor]